MSNESLEEWEYVIPALQQALVSASRIRKIKPE